MTGAPGGNPSLWFVRAFLHGFLRRDNSLGVLLCLNAVRWPGDGSLFRYRSLNANKPPRLQSGYIVSTLRRSLPSLMPSSGVNDVGSNWGRLVPARTFLSPPVPCNCLITDVGRATSAASWL